MPRLIYPPEQAPYAVIVEVIRANLGTDRTITEEIDTQLMCLVEEVGEAAKAWRRYTNRARVTEDMDHVAEELADVIIATRVTMMMLGIDEREVVRRKLLAIVDRGGR